MLLESHFLPSLVIGISITIDVFIVTLSKFRNATLSIKNWTIPLTFLHVILLMIGYFSFWWIAETYPETETVLNLFAFGLIALLIYEIICESIDIKPVFGISSWLSKIISLSKDTSKHFVAIIAISLDAFSCGPAMSTEAIDNDWSFIEISLSFLIIGITVAAFTQLALVGAWLFRKIEFHDTKKLTYLNFYGKYIELSVIGGFGILPLWKSTGLFLSEVSLLSSILISSLVIIVVFIFINERLFRNEYRSAYRAINT
jgi:hypothetical protein